MKLFDQTPLQNFKGEINLFDRIKGTIKYGPSWYPELQAQKSIIQILDRILVKGFILIRNCTLPGSEIIIPLILVGPPGVIVAYVTHLRGTYLAKGDSWRIMRGNNFQPVPINLLTRVEQYARALKVYIERQKAKQALAIEPVLLAANPGMYIDTQRPTVRIVMSDALERWATGLVQSAPILTPDHVEQLADRIVNPRPVTRKSSTPSGAVPQPEPDANAEANLSRAQAIFQASENAEPFDISELGFAFDDGTEPEIPRSMLETSPAIPLTTENSKKKRLLGMTGAQLALLGGMVLVEIMLLIFLAVFFFFLRQ